MCVLIYELLPFSPKDYEFYYGDTGEEKADKTAAFLNKFEGLIDSGSEGEMKEGKTKTRGTKKVEDGGEAFDVIMSQCRIQCAPGGTCEPIIL